METIVQKPKVIHGEVSSVGPLQYKRDGTARRTLTVKVAEGRETQYIGAYLVGEDATNGVIRLGVPIVIVYRFSSSNERIILDYYFE